MEYRWAGTRLGYTADVLAKYESSTRCSKSAAYSVKARGHTAVGCKAAHCWLALEAFLGVGTRQRHTLQTYSAILNVKCP